MGLTYQSQGQNAWQKKYRQNKNKHPNKITVALAGNPNTGKSTLFNALTGLNQHTGNWPGKTVIQVQGNYLYGNRIYTLVDLPGTYSLLANSIEELIARNFICFAKPAATVVVADATCLERNLNLVLQVLEISPRVVVCVNLMDEARRKKYMIDLNKLEQELGVPVVGTAARSGEGLEDLKKTLANMVEGKLCVNPRLPLYDDDIEEAVTNILPEVIQKFGQEINPRWLALRILEGDNYICQMMSEPHALMEARA